MIFDKKTYNYQLDDCYHMVAADCSKRNSHAVLAKEKDNAKHVMIFSENNKIVIKEPATRYTRPTTPFTVKTQTGEERMVSVEVVPDQVAHLLEGQVSVSWARGVLTVDTPAHRVIYNGKTLDVMNKAVFAAGDQCGLCGDHNRMRLSDIKSSSQCVHTSLLSMAHSYRVNSAIEQCSSLSSSAVERLSNEKAMCASSPSSPVQVCFSKEMLPECDIGFIASETMVQEAGFVCLPAAAAEAKDILRRIHLGQDCNELNSMTVTFTTRVRVAKQWEVEYYKNKPDLVIDGAEANQSVYVFKCEGSTVKVNGKCNNIIIDSCKKVAVVFDTVVSSVEFINCQSVQMQVLGKVPTISVEKTDGCQMFINKESVGVEIVTAKSSEMNVMIPVGDDFVEQPVPEQFKTVINGGKLKTTATESV